MNTNSSTVPSQPVLPGMGPMPGMSSSTTTMSGGRRRRAGKRGRRTRRRNMTGGQMSTQSVPKMMGGQTSTMPKMMGGQTSTMPKMMGGRMPAIGSKAQVWHGTAHHTSGGLTRKDLMKHKGRIISRRKHALGKKALKNLVKAGYKAKKGTFKLFRK
jgi:hypothetical protein